MSGSSSLPLRSLHPLGQLRQLEHHRQARLRRDAAICLPWATDVYQSPRARVLKRVRSTRSIGRRPMTANSASSSHYQFFTRWEFRAPLARVWHELMTPEEWPRWWRGVENVELVRKGHDDLGHGAIRNYVWKSRLPYTLRFTLETIRVEPQSIIEATATGELAGRGIWTLSHRDGVTYAENDWRVSTTKWWMGILAPIARPIFSWNHAVSMEWGRKGLQSRLEEATTTPFDGCRKTPVE